MEERPYWPVNAPLGIQLQGPDLDGDVQMLVALGSVVRASSQLEFALRGLFCSLEGTKYAAITAAGQSAAWLLDMCEALLKRRIDVGDEHRAKLAQVLTEARQAMQDRNRFVHDVWASGLDGDPELLRSHRRSHDLTIKAVTLEALIVTSRALILCVVELTRWTSDALGGEAVTLEAQLRWEDHLRSLSHDELDGMVQRRREAEPGQQDQP